MLKPLDEIPEPIVFYLQPKINILLKLHEKYLSSLGKMLNFVSLKIKTTFVNFKENQIPVVINFSYPLYFNFHFLSYD